MNKTLSTGKRALTGMVATTTILWAVGFASVLPASAAAPSDGDLIKASGASVYYYMNGGRYTFPNEKTYKTWFQDFSKVKTLTDAELAAVPLKGNMTYRSGTYLVKITTDPKTYAVEPSGKLRHVPSEDVAKKWWGADWNKKIHDVPDAFFPNYSMGDALTAATPAAGYLYKPAGSDKLMLWDGSAGRAFASYDAFTANGLESKFVQAPAAADASPLAKGADVAAKESSLAMAFPAVAAGTTPTTPAKETTPSAPKGSGLSVEFDASNPAGKTVASGSAYISMLVLKLTASADGDVNVTGITLTKSGIVQDSSISGVGVYDSAGRRHGSIGTFGSQKSTLGFSADPFLIKAGMSALLSVKLNLAAGVNTGTVGIALSGASDLQTDGAKVTLKASPLQGSEFGVVSGAGVIAAAALTAQTVAGGTIATPTQIDLGLKDHDVTKLRLQETSGQEDMKLMRLTLYNNGSAADGDYANITLKDQNGKTVASVKSASASKMLFDLSAAPYVIPKGQQRDFTLAIDVPGTSNSASRTINLTVQNDYDVELYGTSTGAGVLPTTTQTFPVGDGTGAGDVANAVQFRQGSITLSKSSDSPSGKLAPGATNVTLCSFDVKAFGEDMELQRLSFGVTSNGTLELTTGAIALSGTVKINNGEGATIYSASALTTTLYADTNLTIANNTVTNGAAGNFTATQATLNTFYTIKAGTTGKLSVISDLAQTATSADAYTCTLTGFYARRIASNNFVTGASTVTGNQRQVDVTSLTISSNSAYNPTNMVKGGSTMKLGSFNVQAGPAEDITVTTLSLTMGTSTNGNNAIVYTNAAVLAGVSNLTLKIGDKVYGTPISSPTAGSASTFTGSAKIPASGTIMVDVYGDVSNAFDPNPAGGGVDNISTQLAITAAVGAQSQTTVTGAAQNGQTVAMTTNGTLTLTSSATDTPIQQVVHAAMADSPLLALKVSENTNAEDLSLNKLYFAATNGSGNFSDLKLFTSTGQAGQNAQVVNNEIKFTNLNLTIVKGSSPTVLWLKGTSTGSGVQNVGQQSFFAPTYYEYSGKSSGTTVRVSGGVISTAETLDNATTVSVNDASQFSTTDRVALDLNNDGTITGNGETNTSAGYTIAAINTATNVITLGAAVTPTATGGRLIALDNGAQGAMVSGNVNFRSNAMISHNTEPAVTLTTGSLGGTQSPTSGQALATFDVKSDGTRDIRLSSLMLKTSGSYSAAQSLGSGDANGLAYTVANACNTANDTITATINGVAVTFTVTANLGTNPTATALAAAINANPVTNKIVTATANAAQVRLVSVSGFADAYTTVAAASAAANCSLTASGAAMAFGTATPATQGGGISGWQLWQNGQNRNATVNVVDVSGNVQLSGASATARVNSGNYVQFVFASSILVSPLSPTQFVLKANTSNVKAGVTSGSVTAGVSLEGSAGAGQYLGRGAAQVGGNTLGGIRWDYADVNNRYGSSNVLNTPSVQTITVTAAGGATDFYTILAYGQTVNTAAVGANVTAAATAIVNAWTGNATLAARATATSAAGVVTLTPVAGTDIASPFATLYNVAAGGAGAGTGTFTNTGGMMDLADNYPVYGNTVTY